MSLTTIVVAVGGILLTILGAFFKGRLSGAAKERNKQLQERQKARDIADEVDNDIGAMPTDKQREELKKWSKS